MVRWAAGAVITRREVWHDRALSEMPVTVVEDTSDLLAVHLAEGAPFRFPEGDWPGPHPWSTRASWTGYGVLMLHRPDDAYAVWAFWSGQPRTFDRWYVNFQRPFRRTTEGFDTLDHEIDLWSRDLRTWHWKDEDLLVQRMHQGWFAPDEAAAIDAGARRVHAELVRDGAWWDPRWAEWARASRD